MSDKILPFKVLALYKFVSLSNVHSWRLKILDALKTDNIKGTILLAHEGINGTIAGTPQAIDNVIQFLLSHDEFQGMEYKCSYASDMPFFRLKVRLKKEIVTIGLPEVDPTKMVGTYLDPMEWNQLIQDPDTIVIDTRNDYEVGIGTFKGAIDPKTKTFREFPEYVRNNLSSFKNKKIAMCCTGGIRCEKASSFMLLEGFKEVYHLKGGILKYLETVPTDKSLWEGECFVFDQRVALGYEVKEGSFTQCFGCRAPLSREDTLSSHYQEGVSCPQCYSSLTKVQIKRRSDRQKQIKISKTKGIKHIGG